MDAEVRHAHDSKACAGTAAVLSFVFNGLGQLYNGHLAKGLWIIFSSVVSMSVLVIGAVFIAFCLLGKNIFPGQLMIGAGLFLLSLVSICIIGIYSIIDAYRVAMKK